MKRSISIIKIFVILIVLLMTKNSVVKAANKVEVAEDVQEIMTDGLWGWFLQDDTHMDIDIELGKSGEESSSKAMTEKIVGILQVLGSVLSVVALLIIGLRYMFSSLEDRASMKGVLIYYVIGAVMVFATSQLLGVAYKVLWNLSV